MSLFSVASALLALLNMELPLAASPPMPSPFGLWRSTNTMSSKPLPIHVQDRIEVSIIRRFGEGGQTVETDRHSTLQQSSCSLSLHSVEADRESAEASGQYLQDLHYREA